MSCCNRPRVAAGWLNEELARSNARIVAVSAEPPRWRYVGSSALSLSAPSGRRYLMQPGLDVPDIEARDRDALWRTGLLERIA